MAQDDPDDFFGIEDLPDVSVNFTDSLHFVKSETLQRSFETSAPRNEVTAVRKQRAAFDRQNRLGRRREGSSQPAVRDDTDDGDQLQVSTAYASVRYDDDNRPEKHGHFENDDDEVTHRSTSRFSRFGRERQNSDEHFERDQNTDNGNFSNGPFYRPASADGENFGNFQTDDSAPLLTSAKPSNYIQPANNKFRRDSYEKQEKRKFSNFESGAGNQWYAKNSRGPQLDRRAKIFSKNLTEKRLPYIDEEKGEVKLSEEREKNEASLEESNGDEYDREGQEGQQSAYDLVARLRAEKQTEKLKEITKNDRDGSLMSLHKIWTLIPALHTFTRDEVLNLLLQSIIYNQDGIIALNKPYGLPSIGGAGVKLSLSSFLEDLRQKLAPDSKRLFLAHRLDKSTTGAILLTTSEERFQELKELFAKRALTKRYWCITRGLLQPAEGVIDIPLSESEIGGSYRMLPAPRRSQENKEVTMQRATRKTFQAVTEFKTLGIASGCSVVETKIITGVKHQIRSHMGYAMNCPVLGDHKYTHYMKLLPQRLAPITLDRLGIRAEKSRHLPVYLHAKDIIIPEIAGGKNIFIRAPVPKFFLYTLKKLKLVI